VRILVIGAGVSGLTTGLLLLRDGHEITIWAKDVPPHTTSNRAAAVWYPYRAAPIDRVTRWGAASYRTFVRMAAEEPEAGTLVSTVFDLRAERDDTLPEWASEVGGVRHATAEELPPGYADGFVFDTPVIDTSIYMSYLRAAVEQAGGRIAQRAVDSLDEAFAASSVVVNCAGLGSRELLGDTDVHAARGQVVRVRHNGYRRVLLDDFGPNALAYIVPRLHDIILGGTDEEDREDTTPDPEQTRGILQRCAKLAPEFAGITEEDILEVRCGLRPLRSTVRLELERPAPDRVLVHNYGHGGAGVTLSWGCAAEVVELLHSADLT
jgi:D-amino-acid oxidase